MSTNQLSLVFASGAFVALAWYVADYTSFGSRVALWVATAAFAVLGGLVLVAPNAYYGSGVGTETMTLPWGEMIRLTGPEPGIGLALAVVAQFVLIGYIVVAALHQYRAGERREALVLAVGIGWFGLALTIETLSILGVADVPPAGDFGFLGFLVALSFAMVNEAIDGERKLVEYQASLEGMVASRTAELEGVQQRLVDQAEEAAATAERARISRDLHDAVSQLLFSIRLLAGSLPKLWRSDPPAAERSTLEIQRLAGGALAEMRTLLRELRPDTVPHTSLELLITQATEGVSARMDIPVSVDVEMEGRLPNEVHVVTYRVCQEALANVARHANASRVEVSVKGGSDRVSMTVRDDGVGFDPSGAPKGTLGLVTMAERVDETGGRFDVVSAPGRGTVVAYEWEADPD